ncbi:hypothetical protein ACP70R_018335 [Stipagrostis hirtigluma subsp. patula]
MESTNHVFTSRGKTISIVDESGTDDFKVRIEFRMDNQESVKKKFAEQIQAITRSRSDDYLHHQQGHCGRPACGFIGDTAKVLDHLCNVHGWPVSMISYGETLEFTVTNAPARRILVSESNDVFIVATTAVGSCPAVTLLCVNKGLDANANSKFKYKLWCGGRSIDPLSSSDRYVMLCGVTSSASLFDPVPVATELLYMVIPPILKEANSDSFVVSVRLKPIID